MYGKDVRKPSARSLHLWTWGDRWLCISGSLAGSAGSRSARWNNVPRSRRPRRSWSGRLRSSSPALRRECSRRSGRPIPKGILRGTSAAPPSPGSTTPRHGRGGVPTTSGPPDEPERPRRADAPHPRPDEPPRPRSAAADPERARAAHLGGSPRFEGADGAVGPRVGRRHARREAETHRVGSEPRRVRSSAPPSVRGAASGTPGPRRRARATERAGIGDTKGRPRAPPAWGCTTGARASCIARGRTSCARART